MFRTAPAKSERARFSFHDRIDRFEMARIRRQRQVNHVPFGGFVVARKAEVIFDVAVAVDRFRGVNVFEFAEALYAFRRELSDIHVAGPLVAMLDE